MASKGIRWSTKKVFLNVLLKIHFSKQIALKQLFAFTWERAKEIKIARSLPMGTSRHLLVMQNVTHRRVWSSDSEQTLHRLNSALDFENRKNFSSSILTVFDNKQCRRNEQMTTVGLQCMPHTLCLTMYSSRCMLYNKPYITYRFTEKLQAPNSSSECEKL